VTVTTIARRGVGATRLRAKRFGAPSRERTRRSVKAAGSVVNFIELSPGFSGGVITDSPVNRDDLRVMGEPIASWFDRRRGTAPAVVMARAAGGRHRSSPAD
jgi:hypothetical protein